MPRLAALALPITLAAALLAGCSTAPGAAKPDPLPADRYPQIVAMDGLQSNLVYDRVNVEPGPRPPMSVSVAVRWTRDEPCPIQYRFQFFDDRGRLLEPAPDWQRTTLEGKAQSFLIGSSLQSQAVDWRLEIRKARETL